MILIGIDDTDVLGSPGTNQLARAMLKVLGECTQGAVICRHQLFFDPRVPFTSKNGSASIQLPHADAAHLEDILGALRQLVKNWFVEGSDPGLCIAAAVSREMQEFALRCKSEVVTQDEARAVAARAGCHLEGLGGSEQGVIGALAAVGLIAGGSDGRVVHLASWPYPDDFSGPHAISEIKGRGVDQVRQIEPDLAVIGGSVDIGKHLRPSWREGRVVLYVEPAEAGTAVRWRAVKLP